MTKARIARLCGAVGVTLALGACSGADPQSLLTPPATTTRIATDRSTDRPTTSTPSGVPTIGPDGRPLAGDKPFCRTSIPAAWKTAKVHDPWELVTLSRRGSVRWAEPELSWVTEDGVVSHVARLPAPGGLGMAWIVGDHVAYEHTRWDHSPGPSALWLWDSVTRGKPVKLDESDDELPFAPFATVTTNDTQLAWLHPLKDGRREVRLHDTTTGRTRVAHVGHEGVPFFAGDLLVWPEAFAPDAPTRLVAVDRRTLKPAALPQPLADLRDPQEMSTDGRTYAWTNVDRTRLMVWRPRWPAPRVIVEHAAGTVAEPVTWPKVSGDTVSWVGERTYTADVRSGSYVPMTRHWGGAHVWGRFLHIGLPKGSGGSFHLDTSKLPPLPRCR